MYIINPYYNFYFTFPTTCLRSYLLKGFIKVKGKFKQKEVEGLKNLNFRPCPSWTKKTKINNGRKFLHLW